MTSASNRETRRNTDSGKLDIDRRKQSESRRDNDRRVWLDKAYENIYIPSYVNMFHPYFEAKIHAFSNQIEEPTKGEWIVHEMAEGDAGRSRAMRTIKEFALEMIARGLVVDEKGVEVKEKDPAKVSPEKFLLRIA